MKEISSLLLIAVINFMHMEIREFNITELDTSTNSWCSDTSFGFYGQMSLDEIVLYCIKSQGFKVKKENVSLKRNPGLEIRVSCDFRSPCNKEKLFQAILDTLINRYELYLIKKEIEDNHIVIYDFDLGILTAHFSEKNLKESSIIVKGAYVKYQNYTLEEIINHINTFYNIKINTSDHLTSQLNEHKLQIVVPLKKLKGEKELNTYLNEIGLFCKIEKFKSKEVFVF
ncbi:MAG TPA: hypothetical protein ENJ28_09025 [Gammaproteobacteria bacterium]|nr:hypothetical protein [Gammaproteobacteria bacterium]